MRTVTRLLAAALVAALLVACDTEPDAAATVDGVGIASAPFENSVRVRVGDTDELNAEDREAAIASTRAEIMEFFILHEVYGHAVRDAGIEISDEEFAADRAAEIEGLGGEDAYVDRLNELGFSVELFERLVALDTMNSALQAHVFEEEAARTVRHILVETEDEADEVLSDLESGADFGELAAARSTDPGSAQSGGEYPPAPRGQWVQEFDDAVWDADIGDLLGPVETQFGFHVIEVLDETVLTAAEMEPSQLAQVTAPQVNELLEAVFARVEIAVASGIGEWDPELRRVMPTGSEPRVGSPSSGPQDEPAPVDEGP